jgi:ribonuclease M5
LIKLKEAVIVEGKYDKIKLSSIIDGLIIETHGFQIFKDKAQMDMIRKLADTRGILIMTDSDSAGFIIRNYLNGAIDPSKIKHAYIPDVFGKERRKTAASKEGKLGVEGVPIKEIVAALNRAGVLCEENSQTPVRERQITKMDLYEFGLSGRADSVQKRKCLLQKLNLPEHLAPNSLVQVLNSIMSYEEFCSTVQSLFR